MGASGRSVLLRQVAAGLRHVARAERGVVVSKERGLMLAILSQVRCNASGSCPICRCTKRAVTAIGQVTTAAAIGGGQRLDAAATILAGGLFNRRGEEAATIGRGLLVPIRRESAI